MEQKNPLGTFGAKDRGARIFTLGARAAVYRGAAVLFGAEDGAARI